MANGTTEIGGVTGTTIPGVGSIATGAVGAITTSSSSATTDVGKSVNYTVVIQLPIPFLSLNIDLDLVGSFVLPALSKLGIPQAILYAQAQANTIFNNINEDIIDFLKAVPEATVTLVVKIGPTVIVNLRFVATKDPVPIVPPTFSLGLPNLGADAAFFADLPFPAPVAADISVPIPVPQLVSVPILSITGGQVTASGGASVGLGPTAATGAGAAAGTSGAFSAGATEPVVGFPVATPVVLPEI